MPLQRQVTQTVIEAAGSRDVTDCDGNTIHQRYHVGMLYGSHAMIEHPFLQVHNHVLL
jgi:hypothetical protein